jgi:drug/metabolite transporter (DMT)-like permease
VSSSVGVGLARLTASRRDRAGSARPGRDVTGRTAHRHRAEEARPLGLLAVCGAILCFSVSSSLIRKAGIPGPTIAFWRMALANVVWWVILWATEKRFVGMDDIKRLLLPGILFGLNLTLFFEGVTRTSVANAEFIGCLTPLLLVPAGAFFFKERIIPKALLFGLISIIGIAIVLFNVPSDDVATWAGNLIVACSMLTWTAYLLTSRRVRATMSVQRIMSTITPIATLTVLPIVVARGTVSEVTWRSVPYILGLVLLTGTLAHGLIVFAQKAVPVGTISLMQVAQPALAVAWAYILLGQDLRPIQVVGMALVILGLIAVTTVTRRAAPLPEAVEVRDER